MDAIVRRAKLLSLLVGVVISVLLLGCGGGDSDVATYSISGTVTTSSLALAGVTVTLTGGATATTDASGNYSFAGLADGNYTVAPSKTGYTFTPASAAVTVSGANVVGISFRATPPVSATYSISGNSGAGGVTINLSGTSSGSVMAGSDGAYAIPGLVPGNYTLTPTLAGFTFSPTNVSVTLGSANSVANNFVATAVPVSNRQPVVTGAGVPTGPAVTASIDATGGTLVSADGRLTLTVPPNAVAAASTFSIQPISSPAPSSIGVGYRLEPHGVTFAVPVTLAFDIPEAGVSRTSLAGIGPAFRDDQGHWAWGSDVTRDAAGTKLSYKAAHFSDQSLLEGLQIRPLSTTVQEGSSLDLVVIYCTEPNLFALSGPVYECGLDQKWDGTVDWSVNGQIGGNATLGTVKGDVADTSMATFTAPATRPTPNVVAVSAKLLGSSKRPNMTVIAQVAIGQPGTFHGTVQVSTTGTAFTYTAKGDVTVTPRVGENGKLDDDAILTTFDLNGTLTLTPNELMFGSYKCVASKPTQTFKNVPVTYYKSPIGMSFGGLPAAWDVECTLENSQKYQTQAVLQWMTGCAASSMVQVPIADPNKPKGEYTRSADFCTPGQVVGNTTVAWDWTQ